MTCIVGIARPAGAWIGADSCSANSSIRQVVNDSKLVTLDNGDHEMVIGYTTSWRFGQIFEAHVGLTHDDRSDAREYLLSDLVPKVREAMSEHGWLKKDSERESIGNALLVYRGRLFELQNDLSVLEYSEGLAACGSGYEFALGAMHHADTSAKRNPKTVLTAGLDAASHFNPYVMPPYRFAESAV